jgi:RNA recognition motif-containing protein
MSKRLYVGNLAWATNDDSLRNFFSQAGTVTFAQVIVNKFNGRSKGFGFVELEDSVSEQAIAEMNGKDVDGRGLVVNVARPMQDRPKRSFDNNNNNRGGFRGNRY